MGVATRTGDFKVSYTFFHKWRHDIAQKSGINLSEMLGYGGSGNWYRLKKNPITPLLDNKDYEGEIFNEDLKKLIVELKKISKNMEPVYQKATNNFIEACFKADALGTNLTWS